VDRGPVAGILGEDEHVAVQAHLLAVVLADVRVVPVEPWVREGDPRAQAPADGDRRLRLVRAVVAVLEPQAVPVHGRLEIAAVDDVDLDLRALPHLERGSRDGSVVREHAHRRLVDPLAHRRDLERERVAGRQLDHLRTGRLRKPSSLGREPVVMNGHQRPSGRVGRS
jgi:hypothetical protein